MLCLCLCQFSLLLNQQCLLCILCSVFWQGPKLNCSLKEPLKVMISGAPASGKGTQCELIVNKVTILGSVRGCFFRKHLFYARSAFIINTLKSLLKIQVLSQKALL